MKEQKICLSESCISNQNLSVLPYINGKTDSFQKTITTWLTTQLNTLSTNDACAVLSAQAFKINSCQTAAHKV